MKTKPLRLLRTLRERSILVIELLNVECSLINNSLGFMQPLIFYLGANAVGMVAEKATLIGFV